MEIDEVEHLLLFRQQYQAIEEVLKILSIMTVCLQKENLTVAKLRVFIDTKIDCMPQSRLRLSTDANIVELVANGVALVKIRQGPVDGLSGDEQAAAKVLGQI